MKSLEDKVMQNADVLVAPRSFVLADSLIIGLAVLVSICSASHVLWPVGNWGAISLSIKDLVRAAVVLVAWAAFARLFRVYTAVALLPSAIRISASVGGMTAILVSVVAPLQRATLHIAPFVCFSFVAVFLLRVFVFFLGHYSRPGLLGRRSVVIVGTGPRAVRAFRQVRTQLYRSHSLLGFIDSRASSMSPGEIESLFLGPLSSLESILVNNVVDEVLIALPARSCYAEIERTVDLCARIGVEVKYPGDLFPSHGSSHQKGLPGMDSMIVLRPAVHDARLLVKRLVDIVVSAGALLALSPLLLLLAILVKLSNAGRIFTSEECYGLGRRRFYILRFRASLSAHETEGKEAELAAATTKVDRRESLTRISAFLRRTSLYRLPELLNVFTGHMSLVGPRVMSVREASLFKQSWLLRRFSVKPGIFSPYRIDALNNAPLSRRTELDLQYIDNWSLGLDAKILTSTIPAVFRSTGAGGVC
jgi:lipopolysaccharide/colanic/teichoic acid biosynthesis glycosyltransferase